MPKIPFYVPYGYDEEQNYDSKEGLIEKLLDESQKNDEKEFEDIDSLSGSVTSDLVASAAYDKDLNSIIFYNASNEPISTVSMSDITVSGLIEEAYYDKDTKKIIIKFENGDEIQIDVADIVDITEAGDGLVIEDDIMKVKIDESSEDFISVSADGVKIDGINSAITDAVAEETERAEAAEAGLQDAIDAEADRAIAQEATLSALISSETSRAQGAEATLQTNIDNEVSRAQGAEGVLQIGLTNEITRAQGAESALDEKIDGEISRAQGAESDLQDAIDAEVTRAQGIESGLQADITAEVTRATAAEQAIDGKVDAEVTRATAAEEALQDAIDAEATRAQGVESGLQTDITAEATRAQGAEEALQDAIDAEVTRAQGAETTIDAKVDAEVARAETAESGLQADIAAEATRATAAEEALQDVIDSAVSEVVYDDSAKTITFSDFNGNVVAEIDTTDFVKDGMIDNVEVITSGGTSYLVITWNTAAGKEQTWINIGDIFEADNYYTKDETSSSTEIADAITAVEAEITAAIEALDFTDSAVEGKYVATVNEEDGVVSVTRADVSKATLNDYVSVYDSAEFSAITEDEPDVITSGDTINQAFNKIENIITRDEGVIAAALVDLDNRIEAADTEISAVSESVAAEATRAQGVESGLQAAITAEETRAAGVESGLQADINAEVTRATGAEGNLSTAIDAESTRAQGVEYGLQASINDEVARATAAESGLQSDITAEATRAQGVESGLQADITAEETRAAGAEDYISGQVDTLVASAAYDSSAKTITLFNLTGGTASTIDTTDFVKDGMIDSVEILTTGGTSYLVITWNTAAGKEQTTLNIGDLFEADNYYQKSETSSSTQIADAIDALDYTDTAVTGQYVATVNEANGVVSVTRADVSKATLNDYVSVYDSAEFSAITEDEPDVITSGDTINQAFNKIENIITADEKVIANSLVDLNDRIVESSGNIETISEQVETIDSNVGTLSSELATLTGTVNTLTGTVNTITGNVNTISGNVDTVSGTVDTLSGTVNTLVSSVTYDSTGKTITFFNATGGTASVINTDDFVKDGMIDTVEIIQSGGTSYLVITWNTAAGKEQTTLDIGDLFEADNYYTTGNTSSSTQIADAITAMSYTDSAVTGQYVSGVNETNGVISVARGNVADATLNGFESVFDSAQYSGATISEPNKIIDTDTIKQALNKIEAMTADNEFVFAQAVIDLAQKIDDLTTRVEALKQSQNP